MNFPFYIAKRYLIAKSSNNAINIITIITCFGVIVSSLALFIILSGFSGLRVFTNSLLDISDPDIKITASKGKSFLFTENMHQVLAKEPNLQSFSKEIETRIFLRYKNKEAIAQIKGVDTTYHQITKIDSALVNGKWLNPEYLNTAVIGRGISYKLSLGILNFGEALEIYVPKPGKGYITNLSVAFNKVSTQIVGIYAGTEDFENKFVFTDISLARQLLKYKENQITAIEIKLKDISLSKMVKKDLQNRLGSVYKVQTKAELNTLFYKVINTENFISYLIFTLIIIIALFNVIGAMIMMIIDKRKNLKTLLNMGATLRDIKKIFVVQGFLLTLSGMTIGLILGIFLVFIQQQFSIFMITQNLPYPVKFSIINFIIVVMTIVVLGFIASKIASNRITLSFIKKD